MPRKLQNMAPDEVKSYLEGIDDVDDLMALSAELQAERDALEQRRQHVTAALDRARANAKARETVEAMTPAEREALSQVVRPKGLKVESETGTVS